MKAIPCCVVRSACCALTLGAVVLAAGCTREGNFQAISMWNQSRIKPLGESPIPGEQSSSRPLVAGTVARGELPPDSPFRTGRSGGALVTQIPVTVTPKLLARGQERFDIYCSPCHSRLGDGNGMIVARGFPHPPDYKIARLRNAPVGHFFDVMTNGYGAMYSYASRVAPEDRWAIAAYIRLLQGIHRPVVPENQYQEERIRARATGIGTRPTGGGQ